MTVLPTPDELRALLDKATPGPWYYREGEHDDWGTVRMRPIGDVTHQYEGAHHVSVSVSCFSPETLSEFRRRHFEEGERCDPVEAEARLIALAPTLARAYLETVEQLAEARARVSELEGIIDKADRWFTIDQEDESSSKLEYIFEDVTARLHDNIDDSDYDPILLVYEHRSFEAGSFWICPTDDQQGYRRMTKDEEQAMYAETRALLEQEQSDG